MPDEGKKSKESRYTPVMSRTPAGIISIHFGVKKVVMYMVVLVVPIMQNLKLRITQDSVKHSPLQQWMKNNWNS